MPLPTPYTTGTISIGAGASVAIGTGTFWSPLATSINLLFVGTTVTLVLGVTDDTHLAIQPWPGSAVVAQPYALLPLPASSLQASKDLVDLRAKLNGVGVFYYVTDIFPDPAWGNDGDYAIKINTGQWQQWLKVSGTWTLQGTPIGVTNRGAWDSATDYHVNDIATEAGTAYLSNTDNLNARPSLSPSDWSVLGAKGDPGAAGTIWRSGAGAPSNGLGVNGDYYFNSTTSDIYLKSAGAYAVVANVKGTAGVDGTVWRSGTGAPSNGLGVNGDYYFDVATSNIYLKSVGAYAVITNVKGTAGVDGKMVRSGTGAPSNGLGNDGDFYVATDTHFIYGPKAGGVWPAGFSLVGASGGTGAVGATGQRGTDANTLRTGNGAPSNLLGQDGDYYLARDTLTLYGPKATGTWPAGVSLTGTQGNAGGAGQGLQPDATGTLTQRGTYDNQPIGFKFLETDVVPFLLFVKASNTSADWSAGTPFGASAPLGSMGSVADSVTSSFSCGAIA